MLFRARDVGVSADVLRRAVARGAVVRLHHGVYLAAELMPSDQAALHLVRATAVQMARRDLVASHSTAALAHGLPFVDVASVVRSIPVFTRRPAPALRSEREPRVVLRKLPSGAVTVHRHRVGDLGVTTPARTAVDLACELPLAEALMITDQIARQTAAGYVVSQDLRGKLTERVRAVALRPLREACVAPIHDRSRATRAIRFTDPRRESPAESASFGHLVCSGLPVPDCQHAILVSSGRQVFVDFWWEEFGLAGECHGHVKYDGTFGFDDGVLVREADRHHLLLEAGIGVVNWRAADMLYRPATVVEHIRSRLRARGWPG